MYYVSKKFFYLSDLSGELKLCNLNWPSYVGPILIVTDTTTYLQPSWTSKLTSSYKILTMFGVHEGTTPLLPLLHPKTPYKDRDFSSVRDSDSSD